MIKIFLKLAPKNLYTILLCVLLLFHISFNLFFTIKHTAPPTWDSSGHLTLSFIFLDKLYLLLGGKTTVFNLLNISNYYPPFIHILGAITMFLFGRNYEIPLYIIQTGFFFLSIVFLYKVVLIKFPFKYNLAFWSSLIYSFLPQVWDQSHHFHLDMPLVALLLISYYFLLKSFSLKNTYYSLLFFIFLSFVQLTKWYGFIYLIVPFIYEVLIKNYFQFVKNNFNVYISNSKEFRIIIFNLLLGFLMFSVITLPWYFVNFTSILETTKISATQDADDPTTLFSITNIFHYLKMMLSHQIGFISFILVPLSFIYFYSKDRSKCIYLFFVFFIPYIIFTFIQNKDLRYIMPLTPVIAFLIGFLMIKIKRVFRYLYIVYLLVLFFVFSTIQLTTITGFSRIFSFLMAGPYAYAWDRVPTSYSFNTENWQGESILFSIAKSASLEPLLIGSYKVLELSDNRFYSLASFDMYKLQNKFYDMEFKVPYNYTGVLQPTELDEYLSDVAFAIIPLDPGPSGLRNIQVLKQLQSYFFSSDNTLFERIDEYSMPDGNVLYLYKRRDLSNLNKKVLADNYLDIQVSTTLHLDAEKLRGIPYTVHFFFEDGGYSSDVLNDDGILQKDLNLSNVSKFRIDLPKDQLNIKDLRGWAFRDMHFVRIPDYDYIDYIFSQGSIRPVQEGSLIPDTSVIYNGSSIDIKNYNRNEVTYIAYAEPGWNWREFNIKGDSREISLEPSNILRFEVTNPNIYISGFPSNWGFYSCYEGRALCFYPTFESP